MNRRAFVFAGLVLPALSGTALGASDVQVIYVGGQDCPFCLLWRKKYEAAWRNSPEFKLVDYVEVDPPHLRQAYERRYWPGELGAVLEQIPRKSGTPRFLIVSRGRLVFNGLGTNKWERAEMALKNVLG
jgi:hypothetical protein